MNQLTKLVFAFVASVFLFNVKIGCFFDSSIVITLLSIIIASFLGAIFGLIPAAYLTTLAKK